MKRLIRGLVAGLVLSFAATAISDTACDPADVVFAGEGFKVMVVSGNSASKLAAECNCRAMIYPKEKLVVVLDVKELCI